MKIIDQEGEKFIQYKIGNKNDSLDEVDGLSTGETERYIVEIEVKHAEIKTYEILRDESEIDGFIGFDEKITSMIFNFPKEPIDVTRIIQDIQDNDPAECIYLYRADENWNKGEEILPRYMLDDDDDIMFEEEEEGEDEK
jgi:hypothetical protein